MAASYNVTFLLAILSISLTDAVVGVQKRQTYIYPEELKNYAHVHPGTKIIHGTVGRYAPQDWPSWYARTIFKWDGESSLSPYAPNDVRYAEYQRSRF